MDKQYAKIIHHDIEKFNDNVHLDTIKDAALRYGYHFENLGKMISRIRTNLGDIYFYDFVSPQTSIASQYIYRNKSLTKYFFQLHGFNTPTAQEFSKDEKDKALKWVLLHKNSAIKPVNAIHSKGITLNINTQLEFENGWRKALKYSNKILIEEMVCGNDYRLVVVDGKFIAATTKTPLTLVGNGVDSIEELMNQLNKLREKNPHTSSKKKVLITQEILEKLFSLNLTPSSVLEKNRSLQLSLIPNVSAGGTHKDITEDVHKEFQEIVEEVAIRLPPNGYMAVDILAENISLSPKNQEWNLIEINESLSLPHNHFPLIGKGRDVSGKIIEQNIKLLKKDKQYKNSFSNKAPIYDQEEQNYVTQSIKKNVLFRAARERNLTVKELDKNLWYVTDNDKETHYFKYIMPDTMSTVGQKITAYKHISLKLLQENSIPIPQSKSFTKNEQEKAWEYAKNFNTSVVKPYTGSGGKGVFIDIKNKEQFFKAVKKQGKERFVVEKYIKGKDYRVLVIDDYFVAASIRIPAYIVGNGKETLQELIDKKNKIRSKNPYTATKLIKISSTRKEELAKINLFMDSIIEKGKKINLQKVANVSAGGENEDVTNLVHPLFQKICTEIIKVFPNLFMGGIDIQAEDISQDPKAQEWAVIEVNANPDLQMHHFPVHGEKRDVSGVLIDSLFKNNYKKLIKTQLSSFYLRIQADVNKNDFMQWSEKEAYLFALNGWIKYNKTDDIIEMAIQGMPKAIEEYINKCIEFLNLLGKFRSLRKQNYSKNINKGFMII